MAIDKETEAKILRYHFVEHGGMHTIAAQLNIHHSTVDRVLAQAGLPKVERATRPTIIDDYLPLCCKNVGRLSYVNRRTPVRYGTRTGVSRWDPVTFANASPRCVLVNPLRPFCV